MTDQTTVPVTSALVDWNGPLGLPDFAKITDGAFEAAFEAGFSSHEAEIETIAAKYEGAGKRIQLRDITQASTRPPRFVVFGTRLDMLPKSYERYLVNGIRQKLGFDAVPVRVVLKSPKNPYKKD